MLLLGNYPVRTVLSVLFLVLVGSAGFATAQARSTADRTFGLAAFAGSSYAQTDYGSRDTGYMIGGDLNTAFRHFEPALDVRYTSVSGNVVNQTSFAGGLKLQRKIGPLRPYGDFEVGMGTLHFDFPNGLTPTGSPYTHDNSVVKAFGGGMDVRIARFIDLKADAQYQYWKLGKNSSYLNPFLTSIGIAYRIPYRSLAGR
jgi:hypothetical protein